MDQKTIGHLTLASLNMGFALKLYRSQSHRRDDCTWALVSAFYAAVHFVNAYLWETQQIEPRSHIHRGSLISNDILLRSGSAHYKRLYDWGFWSRYDPTFHASPQHLAVAIKALGIIEKSISNQLS